MPERLDITLIRSLAGRPEKQRRIVKSLGLRKIRQSVIHSDSPTIRGMINKIPHLLKVEIISKNYTQGS